VLVEADARSVEVDFTVLVCEFVSVEDIDVGSCVVIGEARME